MRIALILTGGTICSRQDSDGLRHSDVHGAGTALEAAYFAAHPSSDAEFAVQTPLDTLSENLTPQDWLTLLCAISETLCKGLSGILIAHGTDTLDQTAAMLSTALRGITVPVILVSAIAPPAAPDTNAHVNFAAAVDLLQRGLRPGVWAVYQNADGTVYLHRGETLEPCVHGSRSFYSADMIPAASAPIGGTCAGEMTQYRKNMQPPEILLLRPYNGLRYDRIPLTGVSAVLHGTYHSDTANALDDSPYSVRTLLAKCREAGIPCYLAPCTVQQGSYDSTAALTAAGAIPLGAMPLNLAYAALWVGALRGLSGDALTEFVLHVRI